MRRFFFTIFAVALLAIAPLGCNDRNGAEIEIDDNGAEFEIDT